MASKYYTDPKYSENGRLKPWFALTDEERSFILLNAYKRRILSSDDIKGYLRQVRISNFTQILFPLLAFPIYKRTVFRYLSNPIYFTSTAANGFFLKTALVGGSWYAWLNYNPFYTDALNQKEELLKVCENRIGYNLLDLNDVLPRWLTSFEIHRRTQALYNERNGPLAGYLYAQEDAAEPLVDLKSWPRKRRGKISK